MFRRRCRDSRSNGASAGTAADIDHARPLAERHNKLSMRSRARSNLNLRPVQADSCSSRLLHRVITWSGFWLSAGTDGCCPGGTMIIAPARTRAARAGCWTGEVAMLKAFADLFMRNKTRTVAGMPNFGPPGAPAPLSSPRHGKDPVGRHLVLKPDHQLRHRRRMADLVLRGSSRRTG